jgi:hypothetical protein
MEDNEAGALDKSEEVRRMILPADENAALPSDPGKEALDQPAPRVAAQPSPVLRGWVTPVGSARRASRCRKFVGLASIM